MPVTRPEEARVRPEIAVAPPARPMPVENVPQNVPQTEKKMTTKHWGWDLQKLNRFMEESWRVDELDLEVPPAITWRETELGKAFFSDHVHPNLKKDYCFRLKVYKHIQQKFDGDVKRFIQVLGKSSSYKEVQKYFKEHGDK